MATASVVSLSEYLHTSYQPDREYIDGELRERNVGKKEHARVQALLAAWFFNHEREWGVVCYTEWRTQVSESRVRIPDLVLTKMTPQPDVLTTAPLLFVEILSPDDSYTDTQRRTADYFGMGASTVWILDPETRTGRMCSGRTWTEATRLEVVETGIFVELDELFAGMDPAGSVDKK